MFSTISSLNHTDGHRMLLNIQIPSEAFRLGRTRVFFKAGQISMLEKILNDKNSENAPWIFERLQGALANRSKAKATAEEAQVVESLIDNPAVYARSVVVFCFFCLTLAHRSWD